MSLPNTMLDKMLALLASSFLQPLLASPTITDITFNGVDIYTYDAESGRKKSPIVISQSEVAGFIRQLANLSGQQFSVQDPLLDISVGHYRINAVHPSIGRVNYAGGLTFAIRKRIRRPVDYHDGEFMPLEVGELLHLLLRAHCSIVISGITGSGKTELQKYLLANLPSASRTIVIDNISELEDVRDEEHDLTIWETNAWHPQASFSALIRNALRANPDWLVIAESRGGEMLDVLNAALAGHPLITTVHSQDIHALPSRLTRMVLLGDKNLDYQLVYQDIIHHFPVLIHLGMKTSTEGTIMRYITAVGLLDKSYPNQLLVIYQNIHGQKSFKALSAAMISRLSNYGIDADQLAEIWRI